MSELYLTQKLEKDGHLRNSARTLSELSFFVFDAHVCLLLLADIKIVI
jgi:hypothetical protein